MSRCPPTRRVRLAFYGMTAILAVAAVPALAQREAEALSSRFRKAADRVLPAVVSIRPLDLNRVLAPIPQPRPFGPGGIFPGPRRFGVPELEPLPSGSGLVFDVSRGLVLTCETVVQGSSKVGVVFADGRERIAERILSDPRSGLIVLAVDPSDLKLADVQWANSESAQLGDWVLSIGRDNGPRKIVSAGIVSGRGPQPGTALQDDLIQTDAVINRANSGGPLVNLEGEVIGICRTSGGPEGRFGGIGFVIPSETARRVARELAEFGRVRRGFVGINVGESLSGAPDRPARVVINGVAEGSPASEAGLRVNDIVLAIDGRPVENVQGLIEAIENAAVGQELVLTIERQGNRQEARVRIQSRPEESNVPIEDARPRRPMPVRPRRFREPDRSGRDTFPEKGRSLPSVPEPSPPRAAPAEKPAPPPEPASELPPALPDPESTTPKT